MIYHRPLSCTEVILCDQPSSSSRFVFRCKQAPGQFRYFSIIFPTCFWLDCMVDLNLSSFPPFGGGCLLFRVYIFFCGGGVLPSPLALKARRPTKNNNKKKIEQKYNSNNNQTNRKTTTQPTMPFVASLVFIICILTTTMPNPKEANNSSGSS